MFPEIVRDDVFRLESRRLWLRWPAIADAAAIAAIAGRQDVAEMTVHVPHPYPKGEASRQIETWRASNAAGRGLTLLLTGQGDDRTPFGLIEVESATAETLPGLHLPGLVVTRLEAAKVGLVLAPERWGQGLATEALQAVADIVFVLSPVARIEASVRVVNPAARRVLERCGFAYEATVLKGATARGGMVSCDCFRLDRKTWASLKQWRMPIPALPLAASGVAPRIIPAPGRGRDPACTAGEDC